MNSKQIIILWISLSLLLPVFYVGGKMLIRYNREIDEAKLGFTPLPISEQSLEYFLRVQREKFIDAFSIGVFEIMSFSGLAIYWTRKKNRETNKTPPPSTSE